MTADLIKRAREMVESSTVAGMGKWDGVDLARQLADALEAAEKETVRKSEITEVRKYLVQCADQGQVNIVTVIHELMNLEGR